MDIGCRRRPVIVPPLTSVSSH